MGNRLAACVVNIIFMVSIVFSVELFASELTLLKYNYGRRELLLDSTFKPGYIYPLEERRDGSEFVGWYLSTSNSENTRIKKEHFISIDLSIKKEQNNIVAITNIQNSGRDSFFITNTSFPHEDINPDGSKTSTLFWSSVLITTDNIMLKYLGGSPNFGGLSLDRDDWTEIKPNKMLSFVTVLNDNFEFLIDKRRYDIVTSDYWMVKENWFIQRSINDLIFSILNMDAAKVCPLTRDVFYIYKTERLCGTYFDDYAGIQSMLNYAGITGENHDNEISIRSEPVTIEIDGSKIKSLYDKYPYKSQ
ncbi:MULTISPECIES: hypothetical protein [Enterobacterales]|uniref:hypothetical protein n=1 Tax=Enterobacterales TaxID=91347 RepID=UPI002EDB06D0